MLRVWRQRSQVTSSTGAQRFVAETDGSTEDGAMAKRRQGKPTKDRRELPRLEMITLPYKA